MVTEFVTELRGITRSQTLGGNALQEALPPVKSRGRASCYALQGRVL